MKYTIGALLLVAVLPFSSLARADDTVNLKCIWSLDSTDNATSTIFANLTTGQYSHRLVRSGRSDVEPSFSSGTATIEPGMISFHSLAMGTKVIYTIDRTTLSFKQSIPRINSEKTGKCSVEKDVPKNRAF